MIRGTWAYPYLTVTVLGFDSFSISYQTVVSTFLSNIYLKKKKTPLMEDSMNS